MGKFYNWMILVVLLAITGSCQREELPETQAIAPEKGLRYEQLNYESLKRLSPGSTLLLETAVEKAQSRTLPLRHIREYAIDSSSIAYLHTDTGYSSFTFMVRPDPNAYVLQNIIISNYADGSKHTFLAEYELGHKIQELTENTLAEAIVQSTFYRLDGYAQKNVAGQDMLCIMIGEWTTVDKCEGELTTPGERPECYNADGSRATKKVFLALFKDCSGGSSGGSGAPTTGGGSPGPGAGGSGVGGSGGSGNGSNNGPGQFPGDSGTNPTPNPGLELANPDGTPIATSPHLAPSLFDQFFETLNREQIAWLNDNTNTEKRAALLQYLQERDAKKEFAKEAIEALIAGGDVDFTYKVIIDKSFKDNECLMGVFTQLGGAPTFQNYLRNFDSDFSVAHLKLSADSDFSLNFQDYQSAGAITSRPKNYIINIVMNIDPNLEGSLINLPTIYSGLALIHEMIHAEIHRKILSLLGSSNINSDNYTLEQWESHITDMKNNFPGLYDYYIRYQNNTETPSAFHHQQMAQHYRNIIKNTLIAYDNNIHSENFYNSLSWVGLKQTTAWGNLTTEQQSNINSTLTNILNHESYCND